MPDCGITNTFDGGIQVPCKIQHDGSTIGFYGTTATTKPSALTAADNRTLGTLFGLLESQVLANVRTRVAELEDRLQSLGLLT